MANTLFKNARGTYDTANYSDMIDFLTDVWNDSFHYWDCRITTDAAADIATRNQDRAELFWLASRTLYSR